MLMFLLCQDWEHRYLHKNYSKVLKDEFPIDQVSVIIKAFLIYITRD